MLRLAIACHSAARIKLQASRFNLRLNTRWRLRKTRGCAISESWSYLNLLKSHSLAAKDSVHDILHVLVYILQPASLQYLLRGGDAQTEPAWNLKSHSSRGKRSRKSRQDRTGTIKNLPDCHRIPLS